MTNTNGVVKDPLATNKNQFNWLQDYNSLFTKYRLSIEQKFRKLFVNRFAFTNCPEFSRRNQALFFNTLFSFGRVAVKKIEGVFYIFLPFNFKHYLDGSTRDAVLYPAAQYYSRYGWNYDGLASKDGKTFSVNAFDSHIKYDPSDTVIIDQKYFYLSDKENTDIYATSLARFYVILENMSMYQRQLMIIFDTSKGNDVAIQSAFNDVNKTFIRLKKIFNQDDEDAKIKSFSSPKVHQSYFEKLDLSGNITNVLELIEKYLQYSFRNLGLPNQAVMFKKERLISAETTASQMDVGLETKADESLLQIFLEEFNQTFGMDMQLEININSGSSGNNQTNPNETAGVINEQSSDI